VAVVAPAEADGRLAESSARVLVNLAAPGADRALALGSVQALAKPLDPDGVVAALRGVATRGTRVLTAGTSAEVLISLRQALAREGMSVSMAWDGKQAMDLLGMARPDVVVVELGLPGRAGHRFVAQLATCDPLPHLVVVPGDDDAAGFAAVLAQPAYAPSMVPLARLLARPGDVRGR
jgi:DNA-binding response OmpR family regulator